MDFQRPFKTKQPFSLTKIFSRTMLVQTWSWAWNSARKVMICARQKMRCLSVSGIFLCRKCLMFPPCMKGMKRSCFLSLQKVQQGLRSMGDWQSLATWMALLNSSLRMKQPYPFLMSFPWILLKFFGYTFSSLWLYQQMQLSSNVLYRKYSSLRYTGDSLGLMSFFYLRWDLVVKWLQSWSSALKQKESGFLVMALYCSAMALRMAILLFSAWQWQSCSWLTWMRKILELRSGVRVMPQRLLIAILRLISYLFWKLMNFFMKVFMMFYAFRIFSIDVFVITRIRCWHLPSLLYLNMLLEKSTFSFAQSRHLNLGSAQSLSKSDDKCYSLDYIYYQYRNNRIIIHSTYLSTLPPYLTKDSHDLFQFIFINKFIMQSEEEEVTALLKKIEQQDQVISKLKAQENKLANYVKEFREAIDKKTSKEAEGGKSGQDEDKLEKQLEKELENAKIMLKNYQNQLKNLQKKNSKHKFTADDLLEMEARIKKKEEQMRQLNQDIKNLTIVRRKQEKLIEKKEKNEDGSKLTKLVEEIRKQREVLQGLRVKHKQKQQALEKRKMAIEQLEKQYVEKCKKYGEKALNFEEFKEKRVQKRRQESVNKLNTDKKQAKKYLSIKDIINSHLDIQNIEISQKSLSDLRQKKAVAQNSLKIAHKKFQKETQQLQQRVQVLKKQNESLHTKYLQKKKERELVQNSRTYQFKKNSSKTMRKLDPIK